jgi:hypothetical protein
MKPTQIILGAIIGGLIIFLLFGKAKPTTNTIIQSDTIIKIKLVYKDTGSVKIQKIPVIVKSDPDTVWKTKPIDSAKVIADHNKRNHFKLDTSANDVNVCVSGVIFQNKHESFDLIFQNTRPIKQETEQVINNNILPNPSKYSLGLQAIGNNESIDIFVTGSYRKGKVSYKGGFEPLGENKKVMAGIEYNF